MVSYNYCVIQPAGPSSMNFCTIMADSSTTFTFTAAICGFRIYRHSWTPHIAQQLPTERETDNPEDRFAIAVVDMIGGSCSTVGSIPHEFSRVLSHFMDHRGEITCKVTGQRQLYFLDA